MYRKFQRNMGSSKERRLFRKRYKDALGRTKSILVKTSKSVLFHGRENYRPVFVCGVAGSGKASKRASAGGFLTS